MPKIIKSVRIQLPNKEVKGLPEGTELAEGHEWLPFIPADCLEGAKPAKVEVKEGPKEELLVEAPVAALEVEEVEEVVAEEPKKKGKRRRKTFSED